MFHFNIVTLFPQFFESPLAVGLLGKALRDGLISCSFHNPRDFSHNRHRHVDDRPFGGGPGMVMALEPVLECLERIPEKGKILLLSPGGGEFSGEEAASLAKKRNLTLVCGRYEGFDARLAEFVDFREIRIGKAVLNGGETAALAVMEAVSRFVPGFLSSQESLEEESFSDGLLEYPQYTRPPVYRGAAVPEILLCGNHAEIAKWRRRQSLTKTLAREPDELADCQLTFRDLQELQNLPRLRLGRNLSFCLFHYPVRLEDNRIGVSSLTNLDIHDIVRISQSYGMGPFFVLTPDARQQEILAAILNHWLDQTAGKAHQDRKKALEKVAPVLDCAELREKAAQYYGCEPEFVLTSASIPSPKAGMLLTPADIRNSLASHPVIICLGTAKGLADYRLELDFRRMRPLRFLDDNHLSVRAAAAITADRILGDFF